MPFFIKWPGHVPAGATVPRPAAHVDIFATAAAAAGAKMPGDRVYDGIDLMRVIAAEGDAADRPLFFRSGHYKTYLKDGWKLQVSERPKKNWLFNLNEDPTEQHNLVDANPGKLAGMMALLERADDEQARPIWPALIEAPIMIDRPLGGAPRGPEDEYVYWAN